MLQSEGLSLLTSLHQNHFLQTVAACEALYRKDLETLEKTEIYLKKYGYKPVEDDKQQENGECCCRELMAQLVSSVGAKWIFVHWYSLIQIHSDYSSAVMYHTIYVFVFLLY